jgi:hypothetical protein
LQVDGGPIHIDFADLILPPRPWEQVNQGPVNLDPFHRPLHRAKVIEGEPEVCYVVNDQTLWDPILAAVREIYEPAYCCVAGGAIRDYLLGEDPKDIDVFMHLDREVNIKELYDLAQELGWQNVDVVGNVVGNAEPYLKDKQANGEPLTIACLRGKVKGVTVDLILTRAKTGREIVGGFDFHMCEHWYDGEVHSTPKGKYDLQKKQWTPSRPLTEITKKHFERVAARTKFKYTLNMGEPWYMQFKGKEKIK